MKTVELFVEYYEQATNKMVYAVLFAGYMTRRFLYLKKTSITGNKKEDDLSYVKVAKADTKIATGVLSLSKPSQFRSMEVSADDGIFDPRIKKLSESDEKIQKIEEVCKDL